VLAETGADLPCVLRVLLLDSGGARVAFDATLDHSHGGPIELWPQPDTLVGRIRDRFELQLGDDALDRALHVKGDRRRIAEVLAIGDLVQALAPARARLHVMEERLHVSAELDDASGRVVYDTLDDAFLVWRRLALRRAGLDAPSDD
jgi:hypothetical protein